MYSKIMLKNYVSYLKNEPFVPDFGVKNAFKVFLFLR